MSAARTTSPDHTGTGSGTPTPGPVSAHPARRWLVLGAVLLVAGGAIVWWLLAGADGSVGAGRTAVIQPGQAGGGVIFPSDNKVGIALPATLADRPYTLGAMPLCLDGVDGAVVDSVSPESTDGLTVTGFALRPFPLRFGADQVSLAEAGFGSGRTVSGRCSADAGSELGVEFTKQEATTARVDGLLVRWHAGSRSGTSLVPLHLVLCQDADPNVPSCQALR
jgi:hypothetical protein